MNQNQVFKSGEADGWYQRNKDGLRGKDPAVPQGSVDVGEICSVLAPFKNEISATLEIGCSSGLKLEAICNSLGSSGAGIEPSQLAVDDGNLRLRGTDICLSCGTSDRLPFEAASFDLVIFGFSLYLFDRANLMTALAEADRVLRAGGFLAITDFDPGTNQKRPYIHRAGVFTYKQDYAKTYVESGMYYLISKRSFSHRRPFFDVEPSERVSVSILYKEKDGYPTLTV
jgi:SAM-dependent methyltransferase